MMIATYTEPNRTVISFDDVVQRFKAALRAEIGELPSIDTLALVLAKTALETGRWQKMWNWNYGNIKATESYVGMYTAFECGEIINDQEIIFSPDGTHNNKTTGVITRPVPYDGEPFDPVTRFRAHANSYDGAYEYVSFIARGTNYKDAWQALLSGDPVEYVKALHAAGYFTAAPAPYLAAVTHLWSEYRRTLAGQSVAPPLPDDGLPSWAELRARVIAQQFDLTNEIGRAA